MRFLDILLIIISSAGLIHGVLFAVYLCFIKSKKTLPNILLGLILIVMAFRIGKSVLLNFGNDLEPKFIFAGLAFLLLIGPLLRWYVLALTRSNFKLNSIYFLEIIPFILIFAMSFFINDNLFSTKEKNTIILFGSIIICIYAHFGFYIFISWKSLQNIKKECKNILQTKFQKTIFQWLHLIVIGFIVIWVSYFLNIIEDTVPYIVGPIMYSLVVYFLSYKAFQLKITDINGDVFKMNNDLLLFNEISEIVVTNKLYLELDVSLSSLSKQIGKSTQKTSEIINQYANQNFNDFINHFRIKEAKKTLLENQNLTISSIAFDSGFNSLSSFNAAFKKMVGTTPSLYRKNSSL